MPGISQPGLRSSFHQAQKLKQPAISASAASGYIQRIDINESRVRLAALGDSAMKVVGIRRLPHPVKSR